MSSAVSSLISSLPLENRKALVSQLRDQIIKSNDEKIQHESIAALSEVIPLIDSEDDLKETYSALTSYIRQSLKDQASKLVPIILQKIPALRVEFISDCLSIFHQYISQQESQYLRDAFSNYISFSTSSAYDENSDNIVITYIDVLYKVLLQLSPSDIKQCCSSKLADYLLILHCFNNTTEISTLSQKAFGALSRGVDFLTFDLWWKSIVTICQNENVDSTNGYILWLRAVNGTPMLNKSSLKNLQALFDDPLYWQLLINGLLDSSFDIRKYTLHIISQSVFKIDHNIDIETMYWDIKKRNLHLLEWERYSTLVNIVSIDTSIYQAGDSTNDLIRLIGKDSYIPKPWSRCLLATGLKSSADAIRQFVAGVVLSLTTKDMGIFLDGEEFLTDVLLPQLMMAYNFTVKKQSERIYKCPFAEQFASFIESIFNFLDDDKARSLCNCLLQFLYEKRQSFDPARVILARGIEQGLRNRAILSQSNLEKLQPLIGDYAETKIRKQAITFYYLRLLFSVADDVTPFVWINSLSLVANSEKSLYIQQRNEILKFIKSRETFFKFFANDSIPNELFDTPDSVVLFLDIHYCISPNSSIEINANDSLLVSYVKWVEYLHLPKNLHSKFTSFAKDIIANTSNTVDQSQYSLLCTIFENWDATLEKCQWLDYKEVSSTQQLDKLLLELTSTDEINEDNMWFISSKLMKLVMSLKTVLKVTEYKSSVSDSDFMEFANRVISAKIPDRNYLHYKQTALAACHEYFTFVLENGSLEKTVKYINFLTTHFESTDYLCRLQITRSLIKLLSSIHSYYNDSNVAEGTKNMISTLWASQTVDRLVAVERKLHVAYFDLILSPEILDLSKDEDLAEALESVLEEAIEYSFARRGILPLITSKILKYFVQAKSDSKTDSRYRVPLWMGRIMTKIYTYRQSSMNLFKLEPAIASMVDAHPLFFGQTSLFRTEYRFQDVDSKIHCILFFASLEYKSRDSLFCKDLFYYILGKDQIGGGDGINNNTPYRIFVPKKVNDGLETAQRILALQILLVLSKAFTEGTSTVSKDNIESVKSLFDEFIPLLDSEPSPVARIYIEWILASFNLFLLKNKLICTETDPELLKKLALDVAQNDHIINEMEHSEATPRIIGSLERIGLLTARALKDAENPFIPFFYYREYIQRLIPFSTSNKATIRHGSVAMLVSLDEEFEQLQYSSDKNGFVNNGTFIVTKDIKELITNICNHARGFETFNQYRSGSNSIWDINKDFTLLGIFGGVTQRLSDHEVAIITLDDFKNCSSYENIDDVGSNWLVKIPFEVPTGFDVNYKTWKPATSESTEEESEKVTTIVSAADKKSKPEQDESSSTTVAAPLQTKSGFWNAVLDGTLGEEGRDADRVSRGDLIVVASLVDKAPNLGGICRLSEVLGAKLLCLGDLAVKKSTAFKSVAVTADRWMPMVEVKPNDVAEYLQERKKLGYTLIGLEQTDKSVKLDQHLNFPKKSVILLGKEREGIPGPLLAELDFCVEIQQTGVIRSMNIQTATAIIVNAYSVQHNV